MGVGVQVPPSTPEPLRSTRAPALVGAVFGSAQHGTLDRRVTGGATVHGGRRVGRRLRRRNLGCAALPVSSATESNTTPPTRTPSSVRTAGTTRSTRWSADEFAATTPMRPALGCRGTNGVTRRSLAFRDVIRRASCRCTGALAPDLDPIGGGRDRVDWSDRMRRLVGRRVGDIAGHRGRRRSGSPRW